MISFFLNYLNKKKKFPYYFFTPTPYAFGTAAYEIQVILKNIKKKKLIILKIDIFNKLLNYKICSHALHDHLTEDKYIYNFSGLFKKSLVFFLAIEFFIKRLFVIIARYLFNIKFFDRTCFLDIGFPLPIIFKNYNSDYNLKKIKFNKIKIINNKLNVKLNRNISILLKKKLNEYSFFNQRPFVVLHVRDGAYRNDFNYRPWRNSNIKNYNQSIDFLISKGFLVIKIGDNKSKKTNYKNKFYFDYTRSELKSEDMDLFLIKNCNFFIGNLSGPDFLASLFSKPKLITNASAFSFNFSSTDRILPKKILFKNKEISICEFLSLPFEIFHREYPHTNISFVENTPLEILAATKEFYNLYISNFKIKPSKVQKKFNSLIQKRCSIFFSEEFQYLNRRKYFLWVVYFMKFYKGFYINFYLKKHFNKFELPDEIIIKNLVDLDILYGQDKSINKI